MKAACLILITHYASCAYNAGTFSDSLPFLAYEVSMQDEEFDVLRVTGRVYGIISDRVRLSPPARGMGPGIDPIGIRAVDQDGNDLDIEYGDGCWEIRSRGKDFSFTYDVVLTIEDRYTPEVRRMLSSLEPSRMRIIGRDVFLVPEGAFEDGVLVDIGLGRPGEVRSSRECVNGRIIVPDKGGLGSTLAVSGDYRIHGFEVAGTRLELAVGGEWSFDDSELLEVVRSLVWREISWFGSSPHRKHLFICEENPVRGSRGFDHYGVHFGGSILLLLDRKMDRSHLYDTPMSIVAHEFFHNWNGETIHGTGDDLIWFTEGATVYFSYIALTDVNILSSEQYERRRELLRARYLENPHLEGVSLSEAANTDLSDKDMVNLLYDGGFLAAEAIDSRIRELTGGGSGLIDVLKGLYLSDPDGVALDEEGLVRAIETHTGQDLSLFIRELIGTPSPALLTAADVSS
ncbi:MAG TPA: M1 family aminopeptidase [Candidatus Krumholzibacterium sp.]|nr:M1 family aminopeptidase [Candidatus Krumholzibacterium sp.]